MSQANKRQVGGTHYHNQIQHWDWAASNKLDYFQGQITKYVSRWKYKNGVEDLRKAQHFLEKYIELHTDYDQQCLNFKMDGTPELGSEPQAHGYVDQG